MLFADVASTGSVNWMATEVEAGVAIVATPTGAAVTGTDFAPGTPSKLTAITWYAWRSSIPPAEVMFVLSTKLAVVDVA